MGGGCGSAAAKTPLYSSLMTLPVLTPEKRAEIDALASQQISEGKTRLDAGIAALNRATLAGDNVGMQQSVGLMHEGLDELGAGIAARRVLAEGKAPRNLALDWFKREMNLASPIGTNESRPLGVTPFHLFTMGLLIAFALAMLLMYFFKMRRAEALFGRINPDPGSPPPGSSPPLGGAPKPPGAPPSTPPAPVTSLAAASRPPSNASAPGPPTTPNTQHSPPQEVKTDANQSVPQPATSWSTSAATPPSTTDSLSGTLSPNHSTAVLGSSLSANWRGQLRIGSIVSETPSVKTLRLLPASNEEFLPFTFVPGQFMNVAFWIGGARMNRSYSISSSPTKREHLDLTVRREPRGAVSRHMDDLLKVGDQIEAGGPIGKFTFTGTEADSIVLIAGGVGITPMMSISRYLTERSWPGEIFFFYACRAPKDFIFAKQIDALQRANRQLHVIVTMSGANGSDWQGPRGRLSKELFLQTVPNLASRRIHLCGPPAMMEATKAILTELGVPGNQVKTEAFGAVKPPLAAAGTSATPASAATRPKVTFSKSSKSARIRTDLRAGDSPPQQSILELSEELSIPIEFSCRVGTCGVCKIRMTSGEVDQAVEDALDEDDKTKGIILACQAKPKNDVTVDA
jgi:ferredoxin-NADP reductase